MALDLAAKPGVDTTDPDYPNGKITDGVGTGTPVDAQVYQDIHQYFAQTMVRAGITPNNLHDNDPNGYQLVQALLDIIFQEAVGAQQFPIYSGNYQDHGTSPIRFRKGGMTVRIQGRVSNTVVNSSLVTDDEVFVLPLGYRPVKTLEFHCRNASANNDSVIRVNAAGQVLIMGTAIMSSNQGVWLNIAFDID